jgi:hypothetical protein
VSLYLALGLFAGGVSVYGYWFSSRTKHNRLILQPGFLGLALILLTVVAPLIPENWRTGTTGLLIWVVGLGPLLIYWGYTVMRDLLNLKNQLNR